MRRNFNLILRRFKTFKILSLLVVASVFLFNNETRAADRGWIKTAFSGSSVSFVGVNPYQQAEVLVVVDGSAQLTLDGGILWRPTPIPSMITSLAFDPVHPDVMYAGTQRGVYRSTDLGISWQLFGSLQSQVLLVSSIAINNDAIFTTEYAGTGSGYQEMFKFDRNGHTTQLTFPGVLPQTLTSDSSTGNVYVGTVGSLYRTKDSGVSWQNVANVGSIGAFTNKIVAQNGQIWQTSPSGVYKSDNSGISWIRLGGYPEIEEFYPGLNSHTRGLANNGVNAFFGLKETFSKIHEVYQLGGGAPNSLSFPDFPNDIAAGNEQLWVAGDTGLWRIGGIVKNQAQIKRPLVVVPGTLGSWSVLGKWKLDPITGTYNNLMKALEEKGYIKGVTLFDFPYNWRADNNDSAHLLAEKIAGIKLSCQCEGVDVIGHSQGGLVARAYIQSNYYLNDVANLIQLGTPNAGSVEDYSIWEAGVSSDRDKYIRLMMKLFNIESVENGFLNLTTYIRARVPSVNQLLPTFSYIKGREYPDGYPLNSFLDTLNAPANVALLRTRTNLYIVGSKSKITLEEIEVGSKGEGGNWPHGKIVKKIYGEGDDTVPFKSLAALSSPSLLDDEDHGGLAKHPNQIWIQHLLGDEVKKSSYTNDPNRLMLVYVQSPVRISITDPNGQQLNDDVSQIEGAFYTGSNEIVQFATIPQPTTGRYQIKLTGKSSGKYTIGVAIFDDEKGDIDVQQGGETTSSQTNEYDFILEKNTLEERSSLPKTNTRLVMETVLSKQTGGFSKQDMSIPQEKQELDIANAKSKQVTVQYSKRKEWFYLMLMLSAIITLLWLIWLRKIWLRKTVKKEL